MSPEKGLDQ